MKKVQLLPLKEKVRATYHGGQVELDHTLRPRHLRENRLILQTRRARERRDGIVLAFPKMTEA